MDNSDKSNNQFNNNLYNGVNYSDGYSDSDGFAWEDSSSYDMPANGNINYQNQGYNMANAMGYDMNSYVNKLVTQDLGFGQQIEDALRKIQIQQEMQKAEEITITEEEPVGLSDSDYAEFYNSIEEQREIDIEIQGDE